MRKPVKFWCRGGVWYFATDENPKWQSTRCTSRRAAERRVKELQAQQGTRGGTSATLAVYTAPFYTADCPHAQRRREEGKTIGPVYLAKSRQLLDKRILTDEIAEKPLREIRRADVLAFRSRLMAALPDHPNTVNKTMAALKVVIREAVFREDIPSDPTAGVGHVREHRAEAGVFTPEELRRLFPAEGLGPWAPENADDPRNKAAVIAAARARACFLLAASTGMRAGEVLALTWEQIDFEARTVRIDRAWKSTDVVGTPKSGKPRTCPLPEAAAKALHDVHAGSIRLAPTDLVFCYDDGSRYGVTWWKVRFAAALKAANIAPAGRRLTPHGLRHSLNTHLRDAGIDAAKIRAALGWADERIQGNYTHFDATHLEEQRRLVDALFT